MAEIVFGANDPLTNQQWSEGTESEALKKTSWSAFVGASSEHLLQWKPELARSPGDTVTYGLRMQLTGSPRTSTESLEGNEQDLTYYTTSVTVDELVDAIRFDNRMSSQRTSIGLRSDARDALSDQLSNALDTGFFRQLCGWSPDNVANDATMRGNNSTQDPDTTHKYMAGANNTNDEDLAAGDNFTIDLIDVALEKAKTLSPSIRPAKLDFMGGKHMYVCFIHPYQMTSLRAQNTRWDEVNLAAIQGGQVQGNPLFTGSAGVWNNTLIVENSRITTGVNSTNSDEITTVRRAVFCGAQAGAIAWGRPKGSPEGRFTWVEETFDYGRSYGVSSGTIVGMKKNTFNSLDFATITLSSYATAA